MMSKHEISSDQAEYHFVFFITAQEAVVNRDSTLTLKNLDPKTLYMTARPGRDRAFISTDRFMSTWIKNDSYFLEKSPQFAIVYSDMKTNANAIADAIPIVLKDPEMEGESSWKFQLSSEGELLKVGVYRDITLFIDWFPATEAPKPIELELPSLFEGGDL